MPRDEAKRDKPEPSPSPSEDEVEMENGYEQVEPETVDVPEDDPTFLEPTARALEGERDTLAVVAGESPAGEVQDVQAETEEATGDAESIEDEPEEPAGAAPPPKLLDWGKETSAHRVAVELKRIEGEVRTLLADIDPKRKRRLAGTRRWQELEDDLQSWRFTTRFPEPTLQRLQELIQRRHYLFRHLTFISSTRPTWNT